MQIRGQTHAAVQGDTLFFYVFDSAAMYLVHQVAGTRVPAILWHLGCIVCSLVTKKVYRWL